MKTGRLSLRHLALEESAWPLKRVLLCRHTVPALNTSCFSGLCRIQLFLPESRPWLFILGLWVLVHLFVPWFLSVQTEVLDEEDNIKEDGEDPKSKLSWVSEDQRPLVC